MNNLLHPWLGTSEAYRAAVKAVSIPMRKLPARAQMLGHDELLSEALSILTECALPPRDRERTVCAECGHIIPETLRKGAKYCTPQCNSKAGVRRSRMRGKGFDAPPPPAHPKTHIGTMWAWPEDQREQYAIREVGYRLLHFVSKGQLETPSSQTLYNLAVAEPEALENARDIIEAWLESHGIRSTGHETVEELAESARYVLGREAVPA